MPRLCREQHNIKDCIRSAGRMAQIMFAVPVNHSKEMTYSKIHRFRTKSNKISRLAEIPKTAQNIIFEAWIGLRSPSVICGSK